MFDRAKNWIESRIGLNALVDEKFRAFKVPRDAGFLSTLGTVAVVAFLIQAVTGILMLMFYVPHPTYAFSSVQDIMSVVPFGWFFRQVHQVGSNLLVGVVLLHLVNVFFRAAYKKPRELTWVTGGLMLIIVMLAGVTGYLLPWNQAGYWSSTVLTTLPTVIPVVGDWIVAFLRGGQYVTGVTLTRFFAFHVALIPFIVVILLVAHIFMVRRIGFSTSPFSGETGEEISRSGYSTVRYPAGQPFYPDLFTKQAAMVMFYLAIVFFIIAFAPQFFSVAGSTVEANPLLSPDNIKPQWFFQAPYQLIKIIPNNFFGVVLQVVFLIVFLIWPFFDTIDERNILKRPIMLGVFSFSVALWSLLTLWGWS